MGDKYNQGVVCESVVYYFILLIYTNKSLIKVERWRKCCGSTIM